MTNKNYKNEKIPDEFNNFKICQISDLHDAQFGEGQKSLIKLVAKNNPDIIVITGDLVDCHRYNLESSLEFVAGAVEIAPVYYVAGNHESITMNYNNIRAKLVEYGVTVLDNARTTISLNGESIEILGLADPYFNLANEVTLKEWSELENFKILLSHRPELFDLYTQYNMDLVFSGHAHGGQVRLPFIGGLVAPDQGIFPEYTNGFYTQNNTTMYVSRGIGNSIIPLRVFNNPEVVFITLKK